MKQLICEMGGYEVLLRGKPDDARRAVAARVGEHPPVTIHDANVQTALNRIAEAWRLGWLFWGSGWGREPVMRWFADHDLKGNLKPERERELRHIVLNALSAQEAL